MHSYPKQNRLLKKSDFEALKEGAKKYQAPSLIIFYKDSLRGFPRLGISVSAKNYNSVSRNRLKRLIREVFRLEKLKLKAIDLLVVVQGKGAQALSSSFEERLKRDLLEFFKKFNL